LLFGNCVNLQSLPLCGQSLPLCTKNVADQQLSVTPTIIQHLFHSDLTLKKAGTAFAY
jgi:hypothetical protein